MAGTLEKDRVSSDVESETASVEEVQPKPRRTKKKGTKVARRQQQQQQQSGPLDQLPLGGLGGDTVGNTLGGVTNTLGGITGSAVDQQGGGGSKSDTLRLRLDLNLDVEIQLKARIHGDLELALL